MKYNLCFFFHLSLSTLIYTFETLEKIFSRNRIVKIHSNIIVRCKNADSVNIILFLIYTVESLHGVISQQGLYTV